LLKIGLCLELPAHRFISQWIMPDHKSPAAKSNSIATSGEFDFDVPMAENPRLKRRSLKPKSAPLAPASSIPTGAQKLASEAPPHSSGTVRPVHEPLPEEDADAEINAAVKFTQPSPGTTKPTTGYIPRPASSTNPHGTRPATLYYSSNSPRKEQEEPSPMKTTPTASPTSSPSPPSPLRSAAAPSARPATVVDYRANVERQAREQKSVGGVLSIVVYVLIVFFVIGASLAGYGLYAITKQLHQQSLTIDELDKRYAAKHEILAGQLNTTIDTLTRAQAQIGREQELILQQQEAINKLIAADDAASTALKQERQARASETASLRARVNSLENRGTSTQRY
jgi:hypothetical protein